MDYCHREPNQRDMTRSVIAKRSAIRVADLVAEETTGAVSALRCVFREAAGRMRMNCRVMQPPEHCVRLAEDPIRTMGVPPA